MALDGAGRLVASAGFDGTVRVWDATDGTCLRTLTAHSGGVLSVALSADGRTVVSGGFDRTVRVWDAGTGYLLRTLADHGGAVWGVALSGDGRRLVSGSFDGTTRLWDAPSGACLRAFQVDRPYERMDITGLTRNACESRRAVRAWRRRPRHRSRVQPRVAVIQHFELRVLQPCTRGDIAASGGLVATAPAHASSST